MEKMVFVKVGNMYVHSTNLPNEVVLCRDEEDATKFTFERATEVRKVIGYEKTEIKG